MVQGPTDPMIWLKLHVVGSTEPCEQPSSLSLLPSDARAVTSLAPALLLLQFRSCCITPSPVLPNLMTCNAPQMLNLHPRCGLRRR